MKNYTRSGLITAALIAAVFFFVSCENLSVLMAQLDDDVKLANGRYLQIESTLPTQFLTVNPSVTLLIKFDRPVNPDLVGDWIKVFVEDSLLEIKEFGTSELPDTSLDFSYSDISNTLLITSTPYLTSGVKINLTLIAGLPAVDGSILRESQTLTFFTGNMPAGDIDVYDGPDLDTFINPSVKANALAGYTNASGDIELAIETTKVVTHYYVSASYDPLVDNSDPILMTDDPISDSWPVSASRSFDMELTSGITSGDGEKNIYIRFYDDEEEVFSPVVKATTILDTTDPTVSPYFHGSNYTNKSVTVRSGASDLNGIQPGLYSWTSTISPSGKTVDFGSPNSSSTTVVILDGKDLAQVEETFTLEVEAYDSAGNMNTGTVSKKLEWDYFVAEPVVETEPDLESKPDDFLETFLGMSVDPSLHLISEESLGDIGALEFRWTLDELNGFGEKNVPYDDLDHFIFKLNDYINPEKLSDFTESGGEWQSVPLQAFKLYPNVEELYPGYYEYNVKLIDKLGNASAAAKNHISFVSNRFVSVLDDARNGDDRGIWPVPRMRGVNRYPSFSWPVLPSKILDEIKLNYDENYLYFKLFVGEKNTTEVVVPGINRPYWFHSGPGVLPDLGAGKEIAWWYEIWFNKDGISDPKDHERVFSSVDEALYGDTFLFVTGEL